MFRFVKVFFSKEEPPYMLVPNVHGTYTLYQFDADTRDYYSMAEDVTRSEAVRFIRNLERPNIMLTRTGERA